MATVLQDLMFDIITWHKALLHQYGLPCCAPHSHSHYNTDHKILKSPQKLKSRAISEQASNN